MKADKEGDSFREKWAESMGGVVLCGRSPISVMQHGRDGAAQVVDQQTAVVILAEGH